MSKQSKTKPAEQSDLVESTDRQEADAAVDAGVNETTEVEQPAQPEQAPTETVRVKHESISSFSHGGESYDAVDGVFDLPPEVAAVAVETWGFTAAE